jgi:predicted site-specific integrase-resolvase
MKDIDGLTPREAAEKLGVHPGTLANWRNWGMGPKFFRFGRFVRYRPEALKKYLEEHKRGHTA